AGDRYRQCRDDGQSQRNTQSHARALAELAVDLDDAADPLDVRADDVHPDAAAGNGRDLARRGKAGLEDQRETLPVGQSSPTALVQGSRGDRLLDQLLPVDSAAVIVDVDQDLVARLACRDGENSDLAFAGLEPFRGKLDPVVDGVADDVG